MNRLAAVARKHGCPEVAKQIIATQYGFNAMEVQEAFVKITEQAKASLEQPRLYMEGVNLLSSQNLDYFTNTHQVSRSQQLHACSCTWYTACILSGQSHLTGRAVKELVLTGLEGVLPMLTGALNASTGGDFQAAWSAAGGGGGEGCCQQGLRHLPGPVATAGRGLALLGHLLRQAGQHLTLLSAPALSAGRLPAPPLHTSIGRLRVQHGRQRADACSTALQAKGGAQDEGGQAWLENTVTCYLQAIRHGSTEGRGMMARILNLLSFHDTNGIVSQAIRKHGRQVAALSTPPSRLLPKFSLLNIARFAFRQG